jgi:hypothetical protein
MCSLEFAKNFDREATCDWLLRLISATDDNTIPGFVGRDSIIVLYRLLSPLGIEDETDQQGFFGLLQECSEEMGIDSIDNESFDECVAVEVVNAFMKSLLEVSSHIHVTYPLALLKASVGRLRSYSQIKHFSCVHGNTSSIPW